MEQSGDLTRTTTLAKNMKEPEQTEEHIMTLPALLLILSGHKRAVEQTGSCAQEVNMTPLIQRSAPAEANVQLNAGLLSREENKNSVNLKPQMLIIGSKES